MRKNILCFGANSFLAKTFFDEYQNSYNILKVYRNKGNGYYFDFEIEEDADRFSSDFSEFIDGVIFFQGIPPSIGFNNMTLDHFSSMIKINLAMPALLIQGLNSKLNPGCSVIFFSSISQKKGSYDPAYATSKAGIKGLLHSLANACPSIRFNSLALGLVENSPVHKKMSPDFVKRHSERMFNQKLINKSNVSRMINELLINESINRSEISLDGGFV